MLSLLKQVRCPTQKTVATTLSVATAAGLLFWGARDYYHEKARQHELMLRDGLEHNEQPSPEDTRSSKFTKL